MEIYREIAKLTAYGLEKNLIAEEDRTYIINQFLAVFGLDEYEEPDLSGQEIKLDEVLENLTMEAYRLGIIKSDDITTKDLFDTKLMGILTPRPRQVIDHFGALYEQSPEQATDFFYEFSQDTNYIRRERIKKDMRWKADSRYGVIDITINLSKPEKDPKAIAAARNAVQSSYPKCQLCMENEGYAGRMNHPARQNHRIIPITVNKSKWGFQYSPYVYYNEHCIVFNGEHVPMKIDRSAFTKLFDFVKQFPHYFLGSNADLPIVGGSILTHDHFQGGHYEFAMARAGYEKKFTVPGYEDVEAGIVFWPLSVIRIRHKDPDRLIDLADHILGCWRNYTDEQAFIFAQTDGEPHNTITPIARKRGDIYELDLALRNNITTKDCPLGLYHPHEQYHHIKKENIGLIEVMGLAVLPSRLKKEMELLSGLLVELSSLGKKSNEKKSAAKTPAEVLTADENNTVSAAEELAAEKERIWASEPSLDKHRAWAEEILESYDNITADKVMDILKEEIGKVFVGVLEDAGVYKCNEEGRAAFDRFIAIL